MRSHEPHGFSQGLVAVLHLNSEPVAQALLQLRSTLHQGQHDKLPVLSHRGRPLCEKEALFSQCTVLPSVAMREPNSSFGGQCASRLSLWAGARIRVRLYRYNRVPKRT